MGWLKAELLAAVLPLVAMALGLGLLRPMEVAAREARQPKSAEVVRRWGWLSLGWAPLFLVAGVLLGLLAHRLVYQDDVLRELRRPYMRQFRFILISSAYALPAFGLGSALQLARTGWSLLRFAGSEDFWRRGWGPRDDQRGFHVWRQPAGTDGPLYVQGYKKKSLAVAHARKLAELSARETILVVPRGRHRVAQIDPASIVWRSDVQGAS